MINTRTLGLTAVVALAAIVLVAPAQAGTCTSICVVAGTSPEINLDDTSTGVSGWEIEAFGNFEIDELNGVAAPFKIERVPAANLLYLDTLERIGVNTSAPTEELDIRTTLPGIRLDDTSAGAGQADIHVSTNRFAIEGNTGSDIFGMDTTAPANTLFLESTGDVGIGTSNPARDLHIATGQIQLNGTASTSGWHINPGGTGLWFINTDGTNTTPVKFNANAPNDSLVVEGTTGDVGVGTGSPEAPLHALGPGAGGVTAIVEGGSLQVERSGTTSNIRFQVSGGAAGTQNWLFQNNATTGVLAFRDETAGVTPFNFYPGGTALSFVVRNGRWGQGTNNPAHPIHSTTAGGARLTSGGVWTNASSRELKTAIQALDAQTAFDTLDALDPVTFVYKVDPEDGQVGFIAEDVPDLVATPDRKGLASMDIVAVLTKVVKEQQAANEALEARVSELEKLLQDRD